MSRGSGSILSHGPETKVFTTEQAARSVVVTNIASQTADKNIIIYFQRESNGGGEIDNVHIPQKGTAVVTFENKEVVEKVLKHSHILDGSKLKLERFTPEQFPEVLTQVEARVNFGTFDPFPRDTQSILEILKTNTGVRYRNSSGCFTLSGTFMQIEAANKILHHLVKGDGERNSAQTEADPINRLDERGSDSSSISESSSFDVQPKVMQLLKRVHKKKLQDVQETFSVEIDWIENTNQVNISPKKGLNNLIRLQEGCDAFINLYQEFYPNMAREEVELSDSANERLVQQVVSVAEAEDPIIVEKEDKKLVVYAEKNSIRGYVQFLKEKLGIARDSNSKRTRRGQGSTGQSTPVNDKRSRQGGYLPTQHLVHVLDNEVKLSLYKGDITDEAVDAIVNAANERLQHGAGVAAAIVRKGGRQIQEESDRLITRYGTLNVGGAVYTSGGSLSCRCVIHTVGPEWYRHGKDMSRSLLYQACLESLALAVKLNLSSIALTAISSGIFGMPKDTCAEVMFFAIEEFSSSDGAKFSTLRDVRIVIIDEPTLSVFEEEFVKRYAPREASPETMSTQGRPSADGQESTASAPNSKDSAHQSNRNDSSLPTGQSQFGYKTFSLEKREKSGDSGLPREPTNPEKVGKSTHSTTPKSVKENQENGKTNSPSKGQLEEVDAVKNNKSNGPLALSGTGRGRVNLAPSFTGKETTAEPSRDTHLVKPSSESLKGGVPPPGLTVTQEGITLAEAVSNHGAGDQKSNSDDTVKAKNAEDTGEPSRKDLQNAKQVQNLANQNDDSENSEIESGNGNRTDQTSSREGSSKHLNNHDVGDDKQHPQQLKEEDIPTLGKKTDQEYEGLTNPTVNDNNEAVSSQDEVTSRSPKPEETQTAKESTLEDDPSASCTSPLSEDLFSNQDVTDVDKDNIGERRNAEKFESQDHATGPPMLFERQNGHQSGQRCLMCMNLYNDPVFLWRCGSNHHYCKSCTDFLDGAGICPKCRKEGLRQGNQPAGSMTWVTEPSSSLPGYKKCGIIVTHFNFDEGIQGPEHPNPGEPYKALNTTAFLPLNSDGKEVCCLLRKAFDAGVLFAIGKSPTTGVENNIIWNGVELKTSQSGGPASYGYPDPSYIDRVKKQLAEKGITSSQE